MGNCLGCVEEEDTEQQTRNSAGSSTGRPTRHSNSNPYITLPTDDTTWSSRNANRHNSDPWGRTSIRNSDRILPENSTVYQDSYATGNRTVYPKTYTTGNTTATLKPTISSIHTAQTAVRNTATTSASISKGHEARNVAITSTRVETETRTGFSSGLASSNSKGHQKGYQTGYNKGTTENSLQGTTVFYHYTDSAGVAAIKSSGFIKESSEDSPYAHFGEGVYGTNLAPSTGKMAIAKNNWNNGGPANKRRGRVDYAIRVYIPKCLVTDCSTRGRDLLLYKGRLYLNDYKWDVVKVN